jgi:hypothetical protein
MKIAYLILVHNQPAQLKRLVDRLSGTGIDFYIHVDKKSDIKEFSNALSKPDVYFIKNRVKVYWGAYSIVQATVNGFEEIVQSDKAYDFINLLSGQDYPLVSNEYLTSFFSKNKGSAFMEYYSVDQVWKEAIPRLHKYYLTNYPFNGSHQLEKIINKLLPARKPPEDLVFVGRSQWFSIGLNHVKYILQYLKSRPALVRFFLFTWGSDEFVFQTILYNSELKNTMVNDNLRYIVWPEGHASPKTFTIQEADELLLSNKLFARKFNSQIDTEILDFLDTNRIN